MSDPLDTASLSEDPKLAHLMGDLIAELKPAKALAPPWLRAAGFIAMLLALSIALALFSDLHAFRARMMGATDMWLAFTGSTLTAMLAAVAAMHVSLPDRSRAWAFLPLPGLAIWVGASGMGCAREWLLPHVEDATMMESMHCIRFIVGLSIPLSIVMILMLRRTYSLNPTLTGVLAGLSVAAAAATLLNFFHPFDATVSDLMLHAFAISVVVVANRFAAGRLLPGFSAKSSGSGQA